MARPRCWRARPASTGPTSARSPGATARIDDPLTERLQPGVGEPRERRIRAPTVHDALFSVPWAVALALVKGRVDPAAVHDEPLDDPRVRAVAVRTWRPPDPASADPRHFPGEVRIALPGPRARRVADMTWHLDTLPGLDALLAECAVRG